MDSFEIPNIPTLLTQRLRLRPLGKTDIDAYAALHADPEVMHHISGGGPWDRGRSWRHLAFLIGHWPLAGYGMWAVEERRGATFVGVVGFAEPEGWPGFELAGALVRSKWGMGYALEGAQAALQYAFTVLEKEHVISLIHAENQASIRVAERLGERLEGRVEVYGRELLCYGIHAES